MSGLIFSHITEILIAAGLAVAGAFGWWQKRRADRESERANREKKRADNQEIIRRHERNARAKTDSELADDLTRRD